jgi:hypothetical protein
MDEALDASRWVAEKKSVAASRRAIDRKHGR